MNYGLTGDSSVISVRLETKQVRILKTKPESLVIKDGTKSLESTQNIYLLLTSKISKTTFNLQRLAK